MSPMLSVTLLVVDSELFTMPVEKTYEFKEGSNCSIP